MNLQFCSTSVLRTADKTDRTAKIDHINGVEQNAQQTVAEATSCAPKLHQAEHRLEIFWPTENQYYYCTVKYVDQNRVDVVLYGDEEAEAVNLRKEAWHLLNEQSIINALISNIIVALGRNEQELLCDMRDVIGLNRFLCHCAPDFDQLRNAHGKEEESFHQIYKWLPASLC